MVSSNLGHLPGDNPSAILREYYKNSTKAVAFQHRARPRMDAVFSEQAASLCSLSCLLHTQGSLDMVFHRQSRHTLKRVCVGPAWRINR